jgi:hypothetical protein
MFTILVRKSASLYAIADKILDPKKQIMDA